MTDNTLEASLEERREIARILYKVLDALNDVASHPNGAVPPGLWQPLNDAYRELGESQKFGGVPPLDHSPGALDPTKTMEWAIGQLLGEKPRADLLRGLAAGGFTGAQLRYRVATLDYLHTDYVAHGRVSEIPKNDEGWLRRAGGSLRRFLSSGGIVMDSLSAIPFLGVLKIPSEVCSLTCEALDAQNAADHQSGL